MYSIHSLPSLLRPRRISIRLATLLVALTPGLTFAATLRVPTDHATIQGAIVAASAGDEVLVSPGTYLENLDLLGKQLTLRGELGAASTIVDGQQLDRVILMDGGGLVEGFTIRNGVAQFGAGIFIKGITPAEIKNCIIENNQALPFDQGKGGGIALSFDTEGCMIRDNIIRNNYAGESGGGVFEGAGNPPRTTIQFNTIESNGCHVCGGGIYTTSAIVHSNLLLRNWADSFGGGFCGAGTVTSNTVVGNFNNNSFTHGAGIHTTSSNTNIENNIVALNHGIAGGSSGAGIRAVGRVLCNNSWGNDGPDYFGADTTGLGNISLDPLFCALESDDYTLSVVSPSAPAATNACGLMGAFPASCGVTTVVRSTWGSLKEMYR